MIGEREMKELLRDAGEHFEPPAHGPVGVRERISEDVVARPRRRRLVLAAAACVLLVVGAVAVMDGDQLPGPPLTSRGDAPTAAGEATALTGRQVSSDFGGGSADAGLSTDLGGSTGAGGSAVGGSGGDATGAAGVAPPTVSAQRIVRTGTIELEVAPQRVTDTVEQIGVFGSTEKGFVEASTVRESEPELTSATITVRVPVDRLDSVIASVKTLGEVRSIETTGTDVTDQLVDLEARLRAQQAARDQLTLLLAEASTVQDIILVQDRLNEVQTTIEQLQAQLDQLADTADLATLTVSVYGPDAPVTGLDESSGLSAAWDDARRGFGDGVEGLVRASGGLTFAALALAGAIGAAALVRRGYRRLRP